MIMHMPPFVSQRRPVAVLPHLVIGEFGDDANARLTARSEFSHALHVETVAAKIRAWIEIRRVTLDQPREIVRSDRQRDPAAKECHQRSLAVLVELGRLIMWALEEAPP